ncbi:MAG TPA: hypothetical protein VF760_15155, partial [Xanthobacteraceae bacterium]
SKHHADVTNQFTREIMPFFVFSQFEDTDPSLNVRMENIRHQLFSVLRRPALADPQLEQIAASLGLAPNDQARVLAALIEIRDYHIEAPNQAGPVN